MSPSLINISTITVNYQDPPENVFDEYELYIIDEYETGAWAW